jgi:type IX secretion system substrate protein
MKLNLYPRTGLLTMLVFACTLIRVAYSQNCRELTATYSTTESRCTATGTIQVSASGGSGTYNYKVAGPTTTDFTSSSVIGGLQSGTYTLTVKDIVYNCTYQIQNVVVPGTYQAPRFGIGETDVTCMNGNDGTIYVAALTNGRGPFVYTLVAPSPVGVGRTNSTGTFTGLPPGTYAVQLNDSCGAIQTRTISIQNYNWSMTSTSVTASSCTNYTAQINLKDSKGNVNTSGTVFNGFQYGVVYSPGDTTWFNSYSFAFNLGQNRSIGLVAKDKCGGVQAASWSNTVVPSISANVTISAKSCTGFTAAITGQQNLTNANYCLFNSSGNSLVNQPCNPSGVFTNIPYGSYVIKVTNTCYDTVFTRTFTQAQAVPSIGSTVNISNYSCVDVTVTATGQKNLTNPQYCLFNSSGVQVGGCNPSGVFNNVAYGSYTMKVTDGCTGTVFPINFTAAKRARSVSATVTTTATSCTTFTASVTASGSFTNPKYCLVDNLGNPITCNSTGIFTNLTKGSYCINVTDACNDTTIQRCFTVTVPPAPSGGSVAISNKTCTSFTATISGLSNVYNGQYCLYDYFGKPVPGFPCNSTGIFNNVPYGTYLTQITDECSGKIVSIRFTVAAPVPSVGPVVITNSTCSGFTATVSNQQNLTTPNFCLYDNQNNQVGNCNSTGIFNLTTFGTYYIKTVNGCGDSVFKTSFSVTKPVASENATVSLTNQTCTSFSATITGQLNLTNAHYYLKDNTGAAISDNTTGIFDNISKGSYCISTVSSCLDTTISRCFTYAPALPVITLTATPSCIYDSTDMSVQITSGYPPYTVNVYDASGNLIRTTSSSSNNIVIKGLPSLLNAQSYKVTAINSCGSAVTSNVAPNPSNVSHTYTITPKCPSSIAQTGSADLNVVATTNLSSVSMLITQQNFSPVSIGYSYNSGNSYTFSNLVAATYVITYTFPGCTSSVNDTIILPNYAFPSLGKSAAYQCDNNSFSVGASVTGGIGPFTYQVIGSSPALPNLTTTPQSNPVFSIDNGVQYSLIRLRSVDACGNAALNDVSILPLANTIVSASSNCINTNTTLSTDVIPNATYNWYKKSAPPATDSTLIGTGPTYAISTMKASDTGMYVNVMSVNNGCLTKLSYFDLTGICPIVLANGINLTGTVLSAGINQLSWKDLSDGSSRLFILERSDNADGNFVSIGTVSPDLDHINIPYTYTDNNALKGRNFYRLAIQHMDNTVAYTNVVALSAIPGNRISVYPNPADKLLNISIQGEQSQDFLISLYNTAGQTIFTQNRPNIQSIIIIYQRTPGIRSGIYFLKVNNLTTGESNVYKIIFN